MENVVNVEEKVVVKASDLREALKEASDNVNAVRIFVSDYEFFAYCSDERGRYKISNVKRAAYYGISEVIIIVKPETVKKLLELADDLIKTYGEERALIVFYIRQVNENEGRYRIDTLNSTLEDEIEKVNRIYRELILSS